MHDSDPLGLSRRGALAAFAVYALLAEARAQGPRLAAHRWIDAQDEIARALASGQIAPLVWMDEIERLGRGVDVGELMEAVNRAQVTPAPAGSANDPAKRNVRFRDASGAPRRLSYAAALFAFEPHNVITPHGHRHMASAHLVVAGAFRVRNFDRVGDEEGAMIIRPTRDYIAELGHASAMTSARDNVHWFVPQAGRAMTFDVIISGLDPGQPGYQIQAVDPLGGLALGDGSIRAPLIGFAESARRYTADV